MAYLYNCSTGGQEKNLTEFQYNISVDELARLIQKAFPNKDSVSALKMAKEILNN